MTDHDYLKSAKEASHVPHMGSFYALVAIAEELRRMNDKGPDLHPIYSFNVASEPITSFRKAVGE